MANEICLRAQIGDILLELGNDERVFVLDTDLAKSTTAIKFGQKYPERILEMGIAEQSTMSVATGLAIEGKIPFYISFALFTTGTVWTQLRQACYSGANVKIMGTHPGIDDGPDGASHHANEDLALTRTLPTMTVLVPSSLEELRDCIKLAVEHNGPMYIRVSRDTVPVLDVPHIPVEIGKAVIKYDDGNDLAILYEGTATKAAYEGYLKLKQEGYKCKLINMMSIKPIDKELLQNLFKTVKGIITVENHTVIGGLGGAVAEVMAQGDIHCKLSMVGIEDVFTESGALGALKEKYGICGENVRYHGEMLLK